MCFADEFQRRQSAEMQENFAENRERRLKQLAETNSAVRIPRNFSRTPQELDAWLKQANDTRAATMQRDDSGERPLAGGQIEHPGQRSLVGRNGHALVATGTGGRCCEQRKAHQARHEAQETGHRRPEGYHKPRSIPAFRFPINDLMQF